MIFNLSRHSGREVPCVLLNIPDGHTKSMETSGSKAKSKDQVKKQASSQVIHYFWRSLFTMFPHYTLFVQDACF